MNSIFVSGEEALFISPSQNLTGATLDLTGAAAPVSFTGDFGTILLSPTHSTMYGMQVRVHIKFTTRSSYQVVASEWGAL